MSKYNKELRHRLKVTPEYKILIVIDRMCISGLEREIAVDYYINHLSIEEVCDKEGISIGTLHKYKNRFLSKLELYLKWSGDTLN